MIFLRRRRCRRLCRRRRRRRLRVFPSLSRFSLIFGLFLASRSLVFKVCAAPSSPPSTVCSKNWRISTNTYELWGSTGVSTEWSEREVGGQIAIQSDFFGLNLAAIHRSNESLFRFIGASINYKLNSSDSSCWSSDRERETGTKAISSRKQDQGADHREYLQRGSRRRCVHCSRQRVICV